MKSILVAVMIASFFIMAPLNSIGQKRAGSWRADVKLIESKSNATASAEGDLSAGKPMEDLSWASSSSNACFPATQNEKFRGNHVFFATSIPARSIVTVSVTPTDESVNLSLYAYMMGADSFDMVPDLARCITCEADHKWDRPWKGKVQTSERKVEFQNPTQNTYNIFIGVSSPKAITSGKFRVDVKTKS